MQEFPNYVNIHSSPKKIKNSITIDLHNINLKYNIAPQQIILPFIFQMIVLCEIVFHLNYNYVITLEYE